MFRVSGSGRSYSSTKLEKGIIMIRYEQGGDGRCRPPPTRSEGAAAVQGADGRTVRGDVDLPELHVPVVQLPRPAGRAAVLRLVANIAAEEFGHVELVAAAINTMLTGRRRRMATSLAESPLEAVKGVGNPHHFLAGGQGALRRTRRAAMDRRLRLLVWRPRRGPDAQLLPRDRRPERQAEGVRDGRASGGAGADRLSRPWRRPSGRVCAGGREPHRREPDEAVRARIPTEKIPSAGRTSSAANTCASTASRPTTTTARCGLQRPASGAGEELAVVRRGAGGEPPAIFRLSRRSSHPTSTRGDRGDRGRAAQEGGSAEGACRARSRERPRGASWPPAAPGAKQALANRRKPRAKARKSGRSANDAPATGSARGNPLNERIASVSQITSPRELFTHELGDILYVERQPADEACESYLRSQRRGSAARSRLPEGTRGHVKKRLEQKCSSCSARSRS